MASSALAKLHHLPPWILTIMILTLSLSLSSSLAAEFNNFGKFSRTNLGQQTYQPTVKAQDSIADLSKAKTFTETELGGANTQQPLEKKTFPMDRDAQFQEWNKYQLEKQRLKAAKNDEQTSFPDSLDELNKNYEQQKQNFYAEKRKSYNQQKFSNNNYKYGREEAANGLDRKKRTYGTNPNEDVQFSFDQEDDSEWNGGPFQPTNLGSQEEQKNFFATNDEEDSTESFDLSRDGDPTSLDSESFGSREEKLLGTNQAGPWGMSDTRHQNGKFYYDLGTEKFGPNHPYNRNKNKNRYQNDDWEDEENAEGEP